jgi:hypothetical protein
MRPAKQKGRGEDRPGRDEVVDRQQGAKPQRKRLKGHADEFAER